MCTFPEAKSKFVKHMLETTCSLKKIHWVIQRFFVVSDCLVFATPKRRQKPQKGPFFGLPKFPKAPFQSKKWAPEGSFRVSEGAQRAKVSRPPCMSCRHRTTKRQTILQNSMRCFGKGLCIQQRCELGEIRLAHLRTSCPDQEMSDL